jgi:hypothetical protein
VPPITGRAFFQLLTRDLLRLGCIKWSAGCISRVRGGLAAAPENACTTTRVAAASDSSLGRHRSYPFYQAGPSFPGSTASPSGAARLFSCPYTPECVEGLFSEVWMQHPAWIAPESREDDSFGPPCRVAGVSLLWCWMDMQDLGSS